MEKFRLFTDKATGINPFTPIRGLDKISWPRFFLGLLILIGTAPLILVIETAMCGYESLYTVFALFGAQIVVKLLLGPIQWIMTRLYLILMHHTFWPGTTSPFPKNPRKQLLREQNPKTTNPDDEASSDSVKAGSVIIVNCQSPIDVLVLQQVFWSTPLIFAFPVDASSIPDKQQQQTPGAYWTAFRQTAMLRILSSNAIPSTRIDKVDIRALQRLGKKIKRPVVLFGEGTPTNGRSILQFPNRVVVEGDLADGAVTLCGITYANANAVNATIPQVAAPFFVRVLGESVFSGGNGINFVLSRPSALVQMQQADPENVKRIDLSSQKNQNNHAEEVKLTTSKIVSEIKGDALQQCLADCVSFERISSQPCRCVSLSTEDKTKFYEMWVKHGNLV